MKKFISILGSTGSVGLSTLSIIDKKRNLFKPYLFSANKNYTLINSQIKKYSPNYFIINDSITFKKIKEKFKNSKTKILNNFDLINFTKKSDITISAIPGIVGLEPTLILIKSSKKILIANKESVICGWNIIKKLGLKHNTKIIPIDSEHFSIYKLLKNHKFNEIKKIFITASGGPFEGYKIKQLKNINPKKALKHPKWKMGRKISIDSATLMNKILELIEAKKIFEIPDKKIDILIHPESLVHAIVQFKNGLTKMIYHETSMVIPIVNAIFDGKLNIDDFYKDKIKRKNNFQNLSFKKVSKENFPMIALKSKINEYPSTPIIINASNEVLVDHFLRKNMPFLGIFKIIMIILKDRNYKKYAIRKSYNFNQIKKIDQWSRTITLKKISEYYV
jgi:1-deoxy-D-xylulose-5-phosphate reductoisomerase